MNQTRFVGKTGSGNSQRTFLCKNSSSNPRVLTCAEVPSVSEGNQQIVSGPSTDKILNLRRRFNSQSSTSSSSSDSSSSSLACKSDAPCNGRSCRKDCKGQHHRRCSVDLEYLDIYDELFRDPSQAIYHQYIWQEFFQTATKFLEVQQENTIRVDRVIKGSEADRRTKIYGYDDSELDKRKRNGGIDGKNNRHGRNHRRSRSDESDQRLDLNGGRQKSYNRDFVKLNWKYNGVNRAELVFLDNKAAKEITEHVVSYYLERGFPIPPPDVPSKFTNQSIWTLGAGQNEHFTFLGYIGIRFIYKTDCGDSDCDKDECKDPIFVDLVATASPLNDANHTNVGFGFFPLSFVLDTFEPNPLAFKNGHGYPLRIPITRDFCGKFQDKYDTEPIAYLDKECSALTIRVPPREDGYLYYSEVDNTGNPATDVDIQDRLVSFEGTFKILRRKCSEKHSPRSKGQQRSDEREDTQLISTCPRDADLLAQISELVSIESLETTHGVTTTWTVDIPIRDAILAPDGDPTVYYTGVVAPLMNGGSKSVDVYAVPGPINAYVFNEDPTDLPGEDGYGKEKTGHRAGDNPLTVLGEKYSTPSSTTWFDNDQWTIDSRGLDIDVLTGKYCPEEARRTPRFTTVSFPHAFTNVGGHEFKHMVQYATGTLNLLPLEGLATALEMDPKLNRNVFPPFRGQNFAQRHVRYTRGAWTAIRPDNQGASTYGIAPFWKYVVDQFDHNYQTVRRLMDILTSETAGPLFRENDFPHTSVNYTPNNTGGNAAFNQALRELFGSNIWKVWFNFSVAATFLRNNGAIPRKYRVFYPYWLWNTEYSDYAGILAAMTVNFNAQFADWWEKLDENQIIPPTWNTPYTGETVLRTLPPVFTDSCKNLHTFSFNVPHTYNTITVNVTQGSWKILVAQFTPGKRDHSDSSSSSSKSCSKTPSALSKSSRSSHSKSSDSRDEKDICEGCWIQDGPVKLRSPGSHTFKIQGHHPRYSSSGNIRLICVNIGKLSGDGTALADYFNPEPNTGTITITSV